MFYEDAQQNLYVYGTDQTMLSMNGDTLQISLTPGKKVKFLDNKGEELMSLKVNPNVTPVFRQLQHNPHSDQTTPEPNPADRPLQPTPTKTSPGGLSFLPGVQSPSTSAAGTCIPPLSQYVTQIKLIHLL